MKEKKRTRIKDLLLIDPEYDLPRKNMIEVSKAIFWSTL